MPNTNILRWLVAEATISVAAIVIAFSSHMRLSDRSAFMDASNARMKVAEDRTVELAQRAFELELDVIKLRASNFTAENFHEHMDAIMKSNPSLTDHRGEKVE